MSWSVCGAVAGVWGCVPRDGRTIGMIVFGIVRLVSIVIIGGSLVFVGGIVACAVFGVVLNCVVFERV